MAGRFARAPIPADCERLRVKLFTIDPSSTSCGYAVLSDHRTMIECGCVTPDMAYVSPLYIVLMARELVEIISEAKPDLVLIEIPADQAPRLGARGQAKYGMACGIIYAMIYAAQVCKIETVQSDKWPRMIHRSKSDAAKKAQRQRILRSQFASYDPRRDPKLDIADAIEMGQWFFGQQMKPQGEPIVRRQSVKPRAVPARPRDPQLRLEVA